MLLLCPIFYADAATVTSTSLGGNYNDGTTWTGGKIPSSSDDVAIAANATVLMDGANVGPGILSLTVSAGGTLMLGSATANNLRFNIKGDIVNNGKINFWLNASQGMSLYLLGSTSNWSGSGTWNLAQLVVGNSALEFSSDLLITINRTITVGNGSVNAGNQRKDVTFVLSGTENATIASESNLIFYGNLVADKSNKVVTFAQTGTATAYNSINVLGNITLNPNNRLTVGSYNILEIRNNLSGSGRIAGSTTSDIVISGTGNSILFNSGGTGFRNFTVSRPNGASIDSTITINQTLSLQNQCKLYLPAGKSANGNQTFTIGLSTTAGTITGDGYLAQPAFTNIYQLADISINGTADDVGLRFSQTGTENVIHDLTVNKSSGSVGLFDSELLQVRNTFTLTSGNFKINFGTLKLTGSIKTSIKGALSGSPNANLIIGNEAVSSAATVYFDQTDAQSRSLKSYSQTRNGAITLGSPLNVYNLVDLNNAVSANILKSANNLTLISNEAGTARVNTLGASSIVDSVTVQRFIKGGDNSRRSYRLLSSPVYQVNNGNTDLRRYYFSRLQDNILVTGANGPANGFDPSPANGPTIWKYNEPAATAAVQDFIPISSINKSHSYTAQDFLTVGNGFLLFFRGDRTNSGSKTSPPFAVPEDVILSYKGLLNQGNITVTVPYGASTGKLSYTGRSENDDGFNMMGNPYASAIDWESSGGSGSAIALTNVTPTIYILDPATRNYGTYTKGGLSTGNATRYIASGQGFFVKAVAPNPSMTFIEDAKTDNTTNPAVLGPKKPLSIDFIRLNLEKDSLNKDDILLTFKDGQNGDFKQDEDIADLAGMNASVSLSALASDKLLAVNALPAVNKIISTPIFADALADGDFKLKLTDFSDNFKTSPVFLKDNFTKDSINLILQSEYAFFIHKKDAATFGKERFILYFQQTPPAISVTNVVNNPASPTSISPDIKLFPNPAVSEINFFIDKRSTGSIKLNIYNAIGIKTQSSMHLEQTYIKQNIAALQPGIYIAELIDLGTGKTLQKIKFIKK